MAFQKKYLKIWGHRLQRLLNFKENILFQIISRNFLSMHNRAILGYLKIVYNAQGSGMYKETSHEVSDALDNDSKTSQEWHTIYLTLNFSFSSLNKTKLD